MIVDLIGALFFFSIGVIVGINHDAMPRLRKTIKRPMATKDCEHFIAGRHKMEWFWRRELDERPEMRCLTLREYAKVNTET